MNSIPAKDSASLDHPTTTVFLPVALVVFLGFFSIGIPLATLPAHVKGTLGFDNLWIGIVLGLQSVATLLTRHYAGTVADMVGAKSAALRGALVTTLSGLIAMGSLAFDGGISLAGLLFARVVLGFGESLLITGCLAWGVGMLGPQRSGRVMAWSGIAMYGAIAASAPLSLYLSDVYGTASTLAMATFLPFVAGMMAMRIPATPALGKERMPFYKVVNKVWKSGIGLSLSAVGFSAIAGFSALLFQQRNWDGASLVMTLFGVFYIAARLLFGHTPDKFGGKRVALASVGIEIVGLTLIWQASSPSVALVGAALTGFGYSLAFPAFGVVAVQSIEPQFKGVALGAYVAFFDLALGLTGPVAGLVANGFGYGAVYLFGLISCAVAALVAAKI